MDETTRSAIERAAQRARKILEEDFIEQLGGTYAVLMDGEIQAEGGKHLDVAGRFRRDQIVASVDHKTASGMTAADAVRDYVRDAAFTTLNRFVALKMLEARQLVQECVSKGEQSVGYREFGMLCAGVGALPGGEGYRLFLECIFDELSTEIKVLFDRRDVAAVLWPCRQAFEQLLEVLNAADLSGVWAEDETLGWVYQFFNSVEERQAMRDASQAPRNSRELAVRNQFFTPRYVVEFLTDNTLGRIWYEMRRGETALKDRCQYMVRRPDDSYAPRPKKDPRDLRVLDPACGSGHFLLYAFDLLITIYIETWNDVGVLGSVFGGTGATLRADYPNERSLRLAIPSLILRYNLHGVDIDFRCAQIAQLALWMRAQRAFHEFGIGRAERSMIRRANVVVAEPVPGDAAMLAGFAATLDPPLLGELFAKTVAEMHLAGDLGLLLRFDVSLSNAISNARKQYLARDKDLARGYLPGFVPTPKQGERDLSGIDDQRFFEQADSRIRDALQRFVGTGAGGAGVRRRLFAEDAAQGLGLVELSERRFDVVLMNPPFGDATPRGDTHLKRHYPYAANDILAAFVVRGLELRSERGVVGAITSRTGYFARSLKDWRRHVYAGGLYLVADLGEGVMDAAMVEAAAYCIGDDRAGTVFRHLLDVDKDRALLAAVKNACAAVPDSHVFDLHTERLTMLPDAPLAYWVPPSIVSKLTRFPSFEPARGAVRKGLRTGDNFRFVRAHWEVSPNRIETRGTRHDSADGWVPLVMTGTSQPWFSPIYLVLNWRAAGRELRAFVLKYGTESRLIQAKDFYFRAGFSWTRRAIRFCPYAIPPGCIFTGSRPMAFANDPEESSAVVALFASRVHSSFLRFYGEKFAWPNFLEGKLKLAPIPPLNDEARRCLLDSFRRGSSSARKEYQYFEPFLEFVAPRLDLDASLDGGLSFDRTTLLSSDGEEAVRGLFGLSPSDVEVLERDLREALEFAEHEPKRAVDGVDEKQDDTDEDGDSVVLVDSAEERGRRILSYALGCVFGRWDVRRCGEAGAIVRSSDEHLPSVPDGYLRLSDTGADYPIRVFTDGIAVDDLGHARELTAAVAQVLEAMSVDVAQVLRALGGAEGELRSALGVSFFRWHLRTYTLGRRKAPIYWHLATPSASYSVWLYLHALTHDTLYGVQRDYVVPKLAHEEHRLERLRSEVAPTPNAADRKRLAAQEVFVDELRSFLAELRLVAPLWTPNLDDGVVINSAPLWRLFPQHKAWQKELAGVWKSLVDGEYDWSHMAMHVWPERVVPRCATDRSLAIAHGVESVFWVEGSDGKWLPRQTPTRPVEELVKEKTSLAVKAALKNLVEAPAAAGGKAAPKKKVASGRRKAKESES